LGSNQRRLSRRFRDRHLPVCPKPVKCGFAAAACQQPGSVPRRPVQERRAITAVSWLASARPGHGSRLPARAAAANVRWCRLRPEQGRFPAMFAPRLLVSPDLVVRVGQPGPTDGDTQRDIWPKAQVEGSLLGRPRKYAVSAYAWISVRYTRGSIAGTGEVRPPTPGRCAGTRRRPPPYRDRGKAAAACTKAGRPGRAAGSRPWNSA
jgi:hypothetical protein